MKTSILALFLAFFSILQLSAQQQFLIRGVVRDQATQDPVQGANIRGEVSGTGVITDANGTFQYNADWNESKLVITHIAFIEKVVQVDSKGQPSLNLGVIALQPNVIGLDEVHIISSFISDRQTPVAMTTIGSKTIENQIGNQDYPEILKFTPGVYATKAGGGSGDDRLTIRGFQQENIALLLNGVPVSSMENGLVYWSNWNGLTDATEAIQVQRGLGASNVAMNSVGGTVNIITKSTRAEKGGSVRLSMSDYGNKRTIFQFSSGRLKKGTAITFLGSRTIGPGYVEGTYVNGWSYFLSVSQEINNRHQLAFTALGSPEKHGQRNHGMKNEDYLRFGNKFNPSWGIYNGKVLNLSENFYHKPQINLNHYWNLNPRMFIATSAYVSFGEGGGRYSESYNDGPSAWYYRKNNQIDFDGIILNNLNNTDSVLLLNGSKVGGYSKTILTHYKACHYWAGLLSTVRYSLSDKINFTGGIHIRSFRSRLYEEVADLMGGNFWIEQYAWSLSGVSGRNQIKKVGDIINVDNYAMMKYGNLFGQLEYENERINYFLTSTVSSTSYQRKDPFNYVMDPLSEKVRKSGFDIKSGLSYKLGKFGKVYSNVGFYSREPYFKFVFVNYPNAIARDLRNEKISAFELGFEINSGRFTSRLNSYYTGWKDKSLLSRENIQLSDSSLTRSLVRGLNATHAGIEWESGLLILKNLSVQTTLSLGDWKWKNDVVASLYDDNQVLLDSLVIYTKGLYVGDAPQTQLGISVDYSFLGHFNFIANWVYFDRLYANFDPANRNSIEDRSQPFRIPGYGIADLYLSYSSEVKDLPYTFQFTCQNLLDNEAITRGDDGSDHTLSTFTGFWAQGRTFNLSLSLKF